MPDTLGAILGSDGPFAVVDREVVCKKTVDIVFDRHQVLPMSGLGPGIYGVYVGKGVAGETTPSLAHLKYPVLVVMDDDGKGKHRDNTVQGSRQNRTLPF